MKGLKVLLALLLLAAILGLSTGSVMASDIPQVPGDYDPFDTGIFEPW